ncbi:MAG: ABC transporter ATP-binding protein [Erysipelotrichaceae bacterium]|nr:ABC transporter ATP-binding protein [Erysipelotrichaceae bacterium]
MIYKEGNYMIKVNNITCKYKNGSNIQIILEDVSFEIKDGEFVIITGTSGSGKTTLLKILSGIQKPDNGSVYWDDINIYELSNSSLSNLRLKDSGFIYQDFMLIDELNVYDNLILSQRLLKIKDEKRVNDVIEMLSINHLLKKYPSVLSGGEKQRVAIARALINKPKILFCDEPTGSLDFKATLEIMELLSKLNKKYNITVILVTHEQENLKYATRIIKYNNGVLECD